MKRQINRILSLNNKYELTSYTRVSDSLNQVQASPTENLRSKEKIIATAI